MALFMFLRLARSLRKNKNMRDSEEAIQNLACKNGHFWGEEGLSDMCGALFGLWSPLREILATPLNYAVELCLYGCQPVHLVNIFSSPFASLGYRVQSKQT